MSKALPIAMALAATIMTGCGSNSPSGSLARIRVINAIADGPTLDIAANGSKIITSLPFETIQPATTPASYLNVGAGKIYVQGFATGSTTNPIAPIGTISLTANTQYTVVAVGPELDESPPLLLADNNTPPMGTNVEFRFINASPGSPTGGVDIYIVAPSVNDLTNYTPQISALTNGSATSYQSLPYLTGGYKVMVTQSGFKTPLLTQGAAVHASSITTMVFLDNVGGLNGMSTTPLVLNDLN